MFESDSSAWYTEGKFLEVRNPSGLFTAGSLVYETASDT